MFWLGRDAKEESQPKLHLALSISALTAQREETLSEERYSHQIISVNYHKLNTRPKPRRVIRKGTQEENECGRTTLLFVAMCSLNVVRLL